MHVCQFISLLLVLKGLLVCPLVFIIHHQQITVVLCCKPAAYDFGSQQFAAALLELIQTNFLKIFEVVKLPLVPTLLNELQKYPTATLWLYLLYFTDSVERIADSLTKQHYAHFRKLVCYFLWGLFILNYRAEMTISCQLNKANQTQA